MFVDSCIGVLNVQSAKDLGLQQGEESYRYFFGARAVPNALGNELLLKYPSKRCSVRGLSGAAVAMDDQARAPKKERSSAVDRTDCCMLYPFPPGLESRTGKF